MKINSKDFPKWFYEDSTTKRAQGVAIGFARGVRLTMERLVDSDGRYLFLRGRLNYVDLALWQIFTAQIKYLQPPVVEKLMEVKKGGVIMAGDFNLCIDPGIYSTSQVQGTGNAQLKILKIKLYQNQLMDGWKIQHAKIRDYTLHCPVHGSYSRIDYFLIDHRLLESVVSTNIEVTSLSDHAPVTMKMKIAGAKNRATLCRLNK